MIWNPSDHPAVAMPLGGIGTGSIALGSDGGWRQFQLLNVGNHRGDLPGTFMALRVQQLEPVLNQTMVLQAPRSDPGALGRPATAMFNDDFVPSWQRDLIARHGGTSTTMSGTYPIAEVSHDTGGPIRATVRAMSPLVPSDPDASGMPAVLVEVELVNTSDLTAWTWLGFATQNGVGLDPRLNPRGVGAVGYGGNVNRFRRWGLRADLIMDNPSVAPSAPSWGQQVLACEAGEVLALPCFEEPDELFEFLEVLAPWGDSSVLGSAPWVQMGQASAPEPRFGPSPSGRTWLGAVVAHHEIAPGGSAATRFVLAWHFPNRYVDFVQYGRDRPEAGPTRFWVGNHYANRYPDAQAVADDALSNWDDHWAATRSWTEAMDQVDLPERWRIHLAAQPVPLRTPTTFRTHDGNFYGFEGVLGESTLMWSGNVGGACPLNCTHVWNYAQAASALFPGLERSMRETEFDLMQAPSGAIPHRVHLPRYLQQHGEGPVGAPEWPALDGMCGAVLKTYRELRRGAFTTAWVRHRWPGLVALMGYIANKWDPNDTGLLHGIQPSTYDIGLHGANTYMGTYWLAALRAAQELALLLGEEELADVWEGRFERASLALDEACFRNGYYVQVPEAGLSEAHQWGQGCLSDQLVGQWWAHELQLGYLLPELHVREALGNVVRHNLRADASTATQRPYALPGEPGLVLCTWPFGGRPKTPTLYCDEVWTGVEYQVAAHCMREGLIAEAEAIADAVWSRHDGRRRNPFNEAECGDHYVRAMSGWSLLEASLGLGWNHIDKTLTVGRLGQFPILTGEGWGTVRVGSETAEIRCLHGRLEIELIVNSGNGSRFGPTGILTPNDGLRQLPTHD